MAIMVSGSQLKVTYKGPRVRSHMLYGIYQSYIALKSEQNYFFDGIVQQAYTEIANEDYNHVLYKEERKSIQVSESIDTTIPGFVSAHLMEHTVTLHYPISTASE